MHQAVKRTRETVRARLRRATSTTTTVGVGVDTRDACDWCSGADDGTIHIGGCDYCSSVPGAAAPAGAGGGKVGTPDVDTDEEGEVVATPARKRQKRKGKGCEQGTGIGDRVLQLMDKGKTLSRIFGHRALHAVIAEYLENIEFFGTCLVCTLPLMHDAAHFKIAPCGHAYHPDCVAQDSEDLCGMGCHRSFSPETRRRLPPQLRTAMGKLPRICVWCKGTYTPDSEKEHLLTCPNARVVCGHCDVTVAQIHIAEHTRRHLPRKLACPEAGCSAVCSVSELGSHFEKAHSKLVCGFCKEQIPTQSFEAHTRTHNEAVVGLGRASALVHAHYDRSGFANAILRQRADAAAHYW